MATDPFLLRALLAMDAYNQGYSPGVKSVGGQIGEATQLSVALPNGSQNVGFYALAYSLPDGSKIISYRGTDQNAPALFARGGLRRQGRPARLRSPERLPARA